MLYQSRGAIRQLQLNILLGLVLACTSMLHAVAQTIEAQRPSTRIAFEFLGTWRGEHSYFTIYRDKIIEHAVDRSSRVIYPLSIEGDTSAPFVKMGAQTAKNDLSEQVLEATFLILKSYHDMPHVSASETQIIRRMGQSLDVVERLGNKPLKTLHLRPCDNCDHTIDLVSDGKELYSIYPNVGSVPAVRKLRLIAR